MNQLILKNIVKDKEKGFSDWQIADKYGVNLKTIEKAITKKYGVNISNPTKINKVNFILSPKIFNLEENTVWSFKSRGNWATHNGNYRGNWSPYIPRNIVLRYSKENELVLDYFCGAGTTAIKSKLLHRRYNGIDINDK